MLPPFFVGGSGGRTNGKQGKCSHTCYFCIPAGCKNACWGASPNPLNFGTSCPKGKKRGTAQTVPRCIRCGKRFAKNMRTKKSDCPLLKCSCKPLRIGSFFSPNVNISALLFQVFLITETTSDFPPIRTPRTKCSFRCLVWGGHFSMGDFFHHVFIGTVCIVHNQSSVCIQPNAPSLSQSWEREGLWIIYPRRATEK